MKEDFLVYRRMNFLISLFWFWNQYGLGLSVLSVEGLLLNLKKRGVWRRVNSRMEGRIFNSETSMVFDWAFYASRCHLLNLKTRRFGVALVGFSLSLCLATPLIMKLVWSGTERFKLWGSSLESENEAFWRRVSRKEGRIFNSETSMVFDWAFYASRCHLLNLKTRRFDVALVGFSLSLSCYTFNYETSMVWDWAFLSVEGLLLNLKTRRFGVALVGRKGGSLILKLVWSLTERFICTGCLLLNPKTSRFVGSDIMG
jgi:hypothetical protein